MPTEPRDLGAEHVEALYDRDPQYEWDRLDRHRTEYAVTLRALSEYLPPPPARILDCGGGPGRYAIELTKLGYQVTLFDLSLNSLALARSKAAEASVQIAHYDHGTATDLSCFEDNSFDAVLLMGPLYHLLQADTRQQAVREAYRVLKPGGRIFCAFITRYAPVRYTAAHDRATWPSERPDEWEMILKEGLQPPSDAAKFVAYFCRPDEVEPLLWSIGFETEIVLGVEGLVSMIETHINALQGDAWETWVEINYQAAADRSIHGCTEHLLAVSTKPKWRSVLCHIAQELDQAGIPYKVVGGTAAALHGVPVRVKDIDLETTPEGAYRFQSLFQDYVTKTVTLCESEVYRSHFGQFDLNGVQVEVMGDLCRREEDDWVPTTTQTRATVDLDGVPVCTAWLEEETLAYVRRDRLDRAALCLPHCDRARLLALVHAEQRSNVI